MNSIDHLKNSVAIVTGGSSGYRAGIAESLARSGARAIITGRDQQRLDNMIRRLGGWNLEAIRADASSAADWDWVMESIK